MSLRALSFSGGVLAVGLALSACEWSGGSDGGFNTSKIDFDVNISGQYLGLLSGGKAVANTSGGNITSLLIQQTGNAVQVTDSNGQQYRGTVGAPFSFGNFTGDTIPAGASVASFQVSWQGTDGTAAREIDFSGVINVVTIEDVQGTTSDDSTTFNQTSEQSREITSSDDRNTTTGSGTTSDRDSSQTIDGGEQTVVIFEPTGNGTTNVIVTTIPAPTVNTTDTSSSSTDTARDIANSVNQTQTDSTSTTRDRSTTTTATFQITGPDTQFRLRGTWIEEGGAVSNVDARSPGAAATLSLPVDDGGN